MDRFTTTFCIAVLSFITLLTGCASTNTTQAENKEKAYGRWSTTRANVMYSMARQQFETGELDKSTRSIARAIETKPDDPRYHVLAARIYLERSKLERAFISLSFALENNDKHYQAHYLLGVLMQRWQKYDQALEAYESAFKLHPDDVAPLLAISQMLVSLGKGGDAAKRLEDKLVYFEHNAAIRAALGRIYLMQHEYLKAISFLREAQTISPSDKQISEFLVRAYQGNNQHGKAIQTINYLMQDSEYQSRDDLLSLLADSYVAVEQPEQARPIYLQLTRKNPQNEEAWLKLAEVAWAVGDTSRVVQASRKVMVLAPQRHEGYFLLGMVDSQAKRYELAIQWFQKANKIEPDVIEPYLLKGIAYEQLGKSSQAATAYRRVLQLNPNDIRAQKLLHNLQALSKG